MNSNSRTRRRTRFQLNLRTALILLSIGFDVVAALSQWGQRATAQSSQPATCTAPGTTVVTDPAGDQTGAPLANKELDFVSVSVAEPAQSPDETGAFVNKLIFTLKVANLTNVPANGVWQARFTLGAATYYVSAKTDNNSVLTYEYGTIDGTTVNPVGTPDAGTVDRAGGKFVITIASDKIGNPSSGQTLAVRGVSQLNGVVLFTGVDSTSTNNYTLVGNGACAALPTPTATPTPTPSGGTCNASGVSIVTDPAGDHNTTLGTSQQDIRELSAAEPYFSDGSSNLVFTMKVDGLDPNNLQINGIWKIYFNVGTTTYFVNAFNDPAQGSRFEYGSKDANGIDQTAGAADGGSFDAATKSITMKVSTNKVGNPTDGTRLTAVTGVTQILVGQGNVGGSLQQVDTTNPGTYTLFGNAACAPPSTPTPTPTPTPTTSNGPRYTVYTPPSGMGTSAGEPSIGINWNTGKAFFIASTQTLRITFDDCVDPAVARWDDVSFPTTGRVTLDPILYTDTTTGRTFVSQLLGKAASTVYTDNDAGTDGKGIGDWIQTQGSGINSGVDHQTIGTGPFAAPLTRDPKQKIPYPNAVYYASQDAAVAQAAVSLDGGQTYGPAVPMYNLTQCGGIHGHIKVAPDGTAYVPNKTCTGTQGLVVSENNGLTWTVRPVTGSTASSALIDPSVGVATDGTVYFGYVNGSGLPYVAVSPGSDPTKSRGKGWVNNQRIGAELGIVKATFPQTIAGDADRAAFSFLGSKVPGDHQAPIRDANGNVTPNGYRGEWHLYIATTYDGGRTWTTVDATPNDPVQRNSICNSGTVVCDREPNDRNLLDFNDLQVDKQGRVYAAYSDGCVSQACIQGLDLDGDGYKDNDYAARASIARQSGGRGLFAAYDQTQSTVPKSPVVTATRNTSSVHLAWAAPSDGGSPITQYNVYRRTQSSTTPTLIGSTASTSFDDPADASATYFYSVRAVNAVGESAACSGNEVVPAPLQNPCTTPGVIVSTDPSGDLTPPLGVPAALDLSALSVAEPYFGSNVNKLVFTLKTGGGALPASSQWYIIWNRPHPDANFDRNYVALKTDATGAAAYEYGQIAPPNANLPTRIGDADSGSYDAATGTITITVSSSKVDSVVAPQALSSLDARSFYARVSGQPVTGLQATDTLAAGTYQLIGNAACKPNALPFALLAASQTSGPAPLVVSFNAGDSSDSDGTVAEYIFNFGDGSAPETRKVSELGQAAAQTAHTYTSPGSYRATLTVKDAQGAASENAADKVITVNAGGCNTNWALVTNGGTALASSTYPSRNYSPAAATDGDTAGINWDNGGGWNDGTRDVYPDWLEVDFNGAKPIHEIRVYTLQDSYQQPVVPDENTPSTLYGLLDYDVQYWDGAQWATLGSVVNNDRAMRVFSFPEVTTAKVRVQVKNARAHFSRITEVEAFGCQPQ